jgi:putative membrane protein
MSMSAGVTAAIGAGIIPENVAIWEIDVLTLINLLAVTTLYYFGVYRLAIQKTGYARTWPFRYSLSFGLGMAFLAFAYLGPFSSWAHYAFWPHMSQHIVVMMIAAPLIVMSNPITLLFLNLNRSGRKRVIAILRSRPAVFLSKPLVGGLIATTVLLGAHFAPIMNLNVVDHDFMMFIERPLFLGAALLFYYPIMSSDLIAHRPSATIRVLALGIIMIPETLLGIVIHFSPVTLYDSYVALAPQFNIDPVADQKFAGALMWAVAMVIDGMCMMFAAMEWWREQEKHTQKLERVEALAQSELA